MSLRRRSLCDHSGPRWRQFHRLHSFSIHQTGLSSLLVSLACAASSLLLSLLLAVVAGNKKAVAADITRSHASLAAEQKAYAR